MPLSEEKYWDNFYATKSPPSFPSQFAVFTLGEYEGSVIELGCGNGRDAKFFADQGRHVVCVDSSHEALRVIREELQLPTVRCDFDQPNFPDVLDQIVGDLNGRRIFYGRFLLHALSRSARRNLFSWFASSLRIGGSVCLEYRTDIDDFLPKETDKHFRKGLTSGEIFELVNLSGAKVTYFRQGFGFAKFGADDAHVGRLVLERSGE